MSNIYVFRVNWFLRLMKDQFSVIISIGYITSFCKILDCFSRLNCFTHTQVLVSLLLTLNIFHTLLWCFYY